MKTYTVKRNGKIEMEEVRAHTPEDAIDQVQNRWTFDNFGQGGALTERENYLSDDYHDAEFTAEEETEPTDYEDIKGIPYKEGDFNPTQY